MLKPSFAVALATLTFSAAACGPPNTTGGDSSVPCTPTDPCSCAERGAPDFSRETTGTVSASADDRQRSALVRANHWRTAAGLAPINGSSQIEIAATAHAQYLANNPQGSCWPNPHQEASSCSGYTGRTMADRMTAAGYQWMRAGEVINWENSVNGAIDGWIWTVYHREPFMDYRLTDTGYGYAMGNLGGRTATHNVMDFGAAQGSSPTPPSQVAVFPVPGQTAVPPTFRGDLEGPTPPWPGGGAWPSGRSSGTVISIHFPSDNFTVAEHHLYSNQDHSCTEVTHMYIDRDNDPNLTQSSHAFMYANSALTSAIEYVVSVSGTLDGAAFTRTWAFTTQ